MDNLETSKQGYTSLFIPFTLSALIPPSIVAEEQILQILSVVCWECEAPELKLSVLNHRKGNEETRHNSETVTQPL